MAALSEFPAFTFGCEVRQTRDRALVQRAFEGMSPDACDFLWDRLQFESRYPAGELPDRHTLTGRQLLWHELLNAAHQSAGTFFVVTDYTDGECEPIFVSADWTSAQAWAQQRSVHVCSEDSAAPSAPRAEVVSSRKPVKKSSASAAAGTD